MVRRVIVVEDSSDDEGRDPAEPARIPQALPGGAQYADPAAGVLPALPSAPALSAGDRAAINAAEVATRFLLGYGANTARSYDAQLRAYFEDCARYGVGNPLDADEAFLEHYAGALHAGDELAPSVVTLRLSVIRSFYRFAAADRILPSSPAESTGTRAHAVSLPPLTVDGRAVAAHEAAAAFLLGYGAQTRRLYESELRSFFGWCFRARINPLEATRPHVEAWRLHLEDAEGKAASSSNRALAAVRSFFRYCVEEDVIDRSPAEAVRRRRIAASGPVNKGLDRHEALAFLDAASTVSPLYHAVLSLLLLNGLRASEPGSANVERMSTHRGHRIIYVSRKGYADQWAVPLAPYTAGAIDAYLAVRGAHIPAGHPEWTADAGPVFISRKGSRASRAMVWDWTQRVSRRAFPDRRKPVHPHELRATFVTLGLDAGAALRDVQDSAGHADPATTRRYDRGRHSMDRHATYHLATYLATGATRTPRPYGEMPPEGRGTDDAEIQQAD